MRDSILFAAVTCVLAGAEPIRLHEKNPHYFTYAGKSGPLITSGEHYGAVLNLRFNSELYLRELERNGFNLTRTFTGTYREIGTSGHGASPLSPGRGPDEFIAPWAWSDTSGGFEGKKFDLDRWNSRYFERLRNFCRAAEKRGVVVELVMFTRMYTEELWRASPLHPDNNPQGGDWRALSAPRFLTGDSPDLVARQKAVVRKIVSELRDVPNVYFEIANEPAHRTTGSEYAKETHAWHQTITDEIRDVEKDLPRNRRHMIAYNSDYAPEDGLGPLLDGADIINFHYLIRLKPALAAYGLGKALGYDETRWIAHPRRPEYRNTMTPAAGRIEAWEFLLGGGSVYSNLNYAYQIGNPEGRGAESDEFKGYLRALMQFLSRFDLARMRRDTDVAANVSAISELGRQYAIYLHHSGHEEQQRSYKPATETQRAKLRLKLPAGSYNVEWVRPADLKVLQWDKLKHTGGESDLRESPEYTADIALRITRTTQN